MSRRKVWSLTLGWWRVGGMCLVLRVGRKSAENYKNKSSTTPGRKMEICKFSTRQVLWRSILRRETPSGLITSWYAPGHASKCPYYNYKNLCIGVPLVKFLSRVLPYMAASGWIQVPLPLHLDVVAQFFLPECVGAWSCGDPHWVWRWVQHSPQNSSSCEGCGVEELGLQSLGERGYTPDRQLQGVPWQTGKIQQCIKLVEINVGLYNYTALQWKTQDCGGVVITTEEAQSSKLTQTISCVHIIIIVVVFLNHCPFITVFSNNWRGVNNY